MNALFVFVLSLVCISAQASGVGSASLKVYENYVKGSKTNVKPVVLTTDFTSTVDIEVLIKDTTGLCYSGDPDYGVSAILNVLVMDSNAALPKSIYDVVNYDIVEVTCAAGTDLAVKFDITKKRDTITHIVSPCSRKCN